MNHCAFCEHERICEDADHKQWCDSYQKKIDLLKPEIFLDHEILLGHALHGVLIAVGVLSKDSTCNGPELLLAANEYIKQEKSK